MKKVRVIPAALDKKKLKTLVIIPTSSVSMPNDNPNNKGGISINGVLLVSDELITPMEQIMKSFKFGQLSKGETEKYLSMRNTDFDKNYEWPQEIIEVEKVFPDALTVARQQWAGDISDERLDRILRNREVLSDQDALNIAVALYFLKNPRFKEMAFYFCRNYSYAPVWYKIYGLLAEIKDEEVENFFIEYLI
ncbi:hypothetical protein [Desulfosporosinus nitroreducens]|uniref:DUF4192 family protein n=1 Tax=Desulfosporosinus nitroreducens TaxID=2018668 RepID=A0ABT8QP84_9FIRM|nr:hypothetical protein [Desulfosporosinus nitroreducens]MDO0823164.1 hypothetical protein [Desulfosporosinus nitroreducens]